MTRSRTRALVLGSVLVLAIAPSLLAGADSTKDYADLVAQVPKDAKDLKEHYADWKTKFEAFAKGHAGQDAAFDARFWLLQHVSMEVKSREEWQKGAEAIIDQLLAEFPKSEKLAQVAEYAPHLSADKSKSVLDALTDASRPDAVKAAALFAQGVAAMQGGKDAEGKALLATVKEKYGSLKYKQGTYGESAEGWLGRHAASELAIGQTAPEIVGKTIDGKPIKLSDFKGRVVVIDFFGDW